MKKKIKDLIWKIKTKYYDWYYKVMNEQIEKDHEEMIMLEEHFKEEENGRL